MRILVEVIYMIHMMEKLKRRGLKQEYIDEITGLADANENRRFLNDSTVHADLLIRLMVGRAQTGTLIYTGSLPEESYREALAVAQGRIRILADDEDGAAWVREAFPDKVELQAPKQPIGDHFFVVDGRSFRLELDHGKATALANFNEPDVCEKLTKRFERAW